MKISKNIAYTILTCFVLLLSTACNSEPKTTNSVAFYYLKDVTFSAGNENHSIDLNTEKLTRLFGLDLDPMASAEYYQSLITEVHLNQTSSAKLASANPDNYNKFKRQNKIKKFLEKINEAIQEYKHVEYGRSHSSIFVPVAHTINKLAKTKANEQILVIQSDLFENTFILSKYDKSQMDKIESQPQSLEEILDKETPIHGRLDMMTIYIINQPQSDTDKDFYIISNIYKNWLESKGAKVEIMANLNI
ncbi:hypothetical protein ACFLSU_07610 [Bacteroidota bacterium]